jgi:hypothetical protein
MVGESRNAHCQDMSGALGRDILTTTFACRASSNASKTTPIAPAPTMRRTFAAPSRVCGAHERSDYGRRWLRFVISRSFRGDVLDRAIARGYGTKCRGAAGTAPGVAHRALPHR